ncbi:MAG: hypothetical protein LBH60_09315 [Prevotellaceae bacterium]|jgi:hypothetical protein|nr:hypothetical protein [Prevotellaceae bacterium]
MPDSTFKDFYEAKNTCSDAVELYKAKQPHWSPDLKTPEEIRRRADSSAFRTLSRARRAAAAAVAVSGFAATASFSIYVLYTGVITASLSGLTPYTDKLFWAFTYAVFMYSVNPAIVFGNKL